MDYDFTLLGEIPSPASLMIRREFFGAGSFKLTLDRAQAGFGLLARDRVLYPAGRSDLALLVSRVSKTGRRLTADGTLLKGLAKRRTSSATTCSPAMRRAPTCTSRPIT